MIDLEKIYRSGQTFLWDKVLDEHGAEHYIVRSAGDWAIVQQHQDEYHAVGYGTGEQNWSYYFDDQTDYDEMMDKFPEGRIIDDALEAGYGLRILRQTPWEAAVQFIISQNNNIPKIKKSVDALARRFNGQIVVFGRKFPATLPWASEIIAAGPGALEGLGLGYRSKYLWNLAANWEKIVDQLWKEDSYENHFRTLCGVYGIGPKVANCICLFGLHDLDAVPVDVWMSRIIERAMGGMFPTNISGAGVLQQYLFYAVKNCPEIKARYLGED